MQCKLSRIVPLLLSILYQEDLWELIAISEGNVQVHMPITDSCRCTATHYVSDRQYHESFSESLIENLYGSYDGVTIDSSTNFVKADIDLPIGMPTSVHGWFLMVGLYCIDLVLLIFEQVPL